MKKTILALTLALFMLLALASCSKADVGGTSGSAGRDSGSAGRDSGGGSGAQGDVAAVVGTVTYIDGAVVFLTRSTGEETEAQTGAIIHGGEAIDTTAAALCYITLVQGTQIKLDEQSLIFIDQAAD